MAGKVVFDGDVREFSEFIAGLPEEEARRLRKLLREDKVEFLGEIPEGAVLEEPEWCWFIRENEGVDGEHSRDGKYLYRLASRNDILREDLIHRESTALSHTMGIPYGEARKIICLFLVMGWEVRIWRELIRDERGLYYWVQLIESEVEREKYLDMLRRKEVSLVETKSGEKVSEVDDDNEEVDGDSLDYFDDSLYGLSEEGDLNTYLAHRVWRNWTGEIRIPCKGYRVDENENFCESEDSGRNLSDPEVERMIRSIVTVISGRKAYEISNRVKEWLKANGRNEVYQRYRKALKRAWNIRRQLPSDAPLEERIKASRNVW